MIIEAVISAIADVFVTVVVMVVALYAVLKNKDSIWVFSFYLIKYTHLYTYTH